MLKQSHLLLRALLLCIALIGLSTAVRAEPTKTVYHVHDGLTHATHAMYNIMFQLR